MPVCGAGEWRGLPVAIKVLLFHSDHAKVAEVASEAAAIATNLTHSSLVATYSHDLHCLDNAATAASPTFPAEPKIFKLYLIQVRRGISLGTLRCYYSWFVGSFCWVSDGANPRIFSTARGAVPCTSPSVGPTATSARMP